MWFYVRLVSAEQSLTHLACRSKGRTLIYTYIFNDDYDNNVYIDPYPLYGADCRAFLVFIPPCIIRIADLCGNV